jgi:hypothetical protein
MSSESVPRSRVNSLPNLALLWFCIAAAPIAWMTHLTVEYFFVTVHCQLNGGNVEALLAATTIGSAVICVAGGVAGFLLWRRLSHEEQTASIGRARFMAASGVLLSILFLVGIILGTVPVYALELCNDAH